MSILLLTTAETAIRVTLYGVYYAGKGVWWLAKRAIWGRPVTVEERLLQQQEQIIRAQDQQANNENQQQIVAAMQHQIEQQAEIINMLRQADAAKKNLNA